MISGGHLGSLCEELELLFCVVDLERRANLNLAAAALLMLLMLLHVKNIKDS